MADDKPLRSGEISGRPEPGPQSSDLPMGDAMPTALDHRLGDLAQVLGDATQMTGAPQDRATYFEGLRRILCTAERPDQAGDQSAQAQGIRDLVEAFGRAWGRKLSGDQCALLEQGLHALAQINANDPNHKDILLVRNSIDLFLDTIAQVLGRGFDSHERRMLTRALVRSIGDGSQNPGSA